MLDVVWDFKSINTKNRLYKRFIQTDKNNVALFDTLKAEYHIYRARLRRTIREAKRMFYARTFLLYKNDMRKTWGVINDTLQSNRRSRGQSEFIFGNRIISDSDEIANHFNDYSLISPVHYHNKFSLSIHLITI